MYSALTKSYNSKKPPKLNPRPLLLLSQAEQMLRDTTTKSSHSIRRTRASQVTSTRTCPSHRGLERSSLRQLSNVTENSSERLGPTMESSVVSSKPKDTPMPKRILRTRDEVPLDYLLACRLQWVDTTSPTLLSREGQVLPLVEPPNLTTIISSSNNKRSSKSKWRNGSRGSEPGLPPNTLKRRKTPPMFKLQRVRIRIAVDATTRM